MADTLPPYLSRREIAAVFGNDVKAISTFEDLQRISFIETPELVSTAQDSADTADAKAVAAQSSADGAATAASDAQSAADAAQVSADAAAAVAAAAIATKVDKGSGPAWAAPTGTQARTALADFTAGTISNPPTQAEVQVVANAVQAVSRAVVALIADLIANETINT